MYFTMHTVFTFIYGAKLFLWLEISMIICSLMLTNQGLIDMLSTTSVRTCAMIWRGPNL